ncbi:hypothetical protein BBO99_00000146 [Phytophthora kernoviae]|uniref:Transcription factor IIIC subunit 5 HTH domain-containing protein n=1 Tax=Phytophthora kernoviae TaxID=325452 RepID=A0A3R7JZK5_9STRA|nr:hypothetical protein JM18_000394 [Phytophthora kernoviae]KAG2532650.1 hypothetical protein JM16_000286 [Phytophthora kernoviae]RLM96849.1 hypothetical protein BBI17_000248 [Phytophthora kernoviae]RLN85859.1 hypothetical protein BBO99_00000146 [Phytophthora kernoviae]
MPTKDTITVAEEEAEPAVDATPLSKPSTRQLELQASLRPYLKVEKEEQLELIPEVFSKVDLPLKYEFRQRSGYLPTAAAKKPSNTMSYLNFHDDAPAPAGPKPDQPVLRRRSVGVEDNGVEAHVLEVLQTKLERKPVWLRSKLFEGLDALERRAARRLLRKLCYVFVDGPWRGSWIRMGYDPRAPEVSDTASRYQVIELRNNRELVHSKVTHPTRKRTKKFVTASSGNANGDNAHVKGPRIVKVTQTSALENAQASKRRRKERFTRAGTSSTVQTTSGVSEKVYEIFGVQLTSANVLFQLDEIDDDEVREWMAQFVKQSTPSLLGGWYPTQMFLPLREIIRLRIAALVGRSKAELESRRKRLDALKKQALSDYADELAGNGRSTNSSHQKSNGDKGTTGSVSSSNNTAAVAEEDEDLAFERSLIRERNAGSNVAKLSANDGAETGEEEDGEDDIESQEEEDDDNSANGRSRAAFEEDEDDDDQEEEEEAQAKDATLDKQQDAEEKNSARETDPSTSPAKPTTKEYSF